MSFTTIGDLAQGFALRRQNTVLKQQMDRLSQELASGLAADVTQHLSGNFMQLADVQHALDLAQSYQRGADQGRMETSVMQTALDTIQTRSEALGLSALSFAGSTVSAGINAFAADARGSFDTLVAALNTNFGGRSLFAGDEVTEAPLIAADDFFLALQTAVAGSATAGALTTALDAFFDPLGGFETLVYQGGTTARNAYQLGEGESVSLDLRADDAAFRAVFKQVALGALLTDPGVTLTSAEQKDLITGLGEGLLAGQSQVTYIRADLGFAEERIDRAGTRLAAEQASLGLLQAELLAIDPFKTATELETVQVQLETLYAITSRTSRLSLVNYL